MMYYYCTLNLMHFIGFLGSGFAKECMKIIWVNYECAFVIALILTQFVDMIYNTCNKHVRNIKEGLRTKLSDKVPTKRSF